MQHCTFSVLSFCLAAMLLALGCEKNGTEITTVRQMDTAAPAAQPAGASSAERFGFRPNAAAGMGARSAGGYQSDTPPGWQAMPVSDARPVNFRVANDPNAEAYFATLGSGGGGLVANVNRWRKQMGLPEISEEDVAQLPKKQLLGHEAVYVTLDGAFSGMGSEPKENYRMHGLIAIEGDKAYFAKMTGPAPVLEGQEENFLAFAASLKEGADPHAGMTADPHAGIAGLGAGMGTVTAWQWQAPETWSKSADRPMRLVTYTSGPENKNEVYVAELGGPAGGIEANINRWRQQMGQPALTPDEIEALPKVTVLGQEAAIVEIDGTFTDDMRGGTIPEATMYGAIIPAGDRMLFVKMIGPQAAMDAEKDNFIAFTQSITKAE